MLIMGDCFNRHLKWCVGAKIRGGGEGMRGGGGEGGRGGGALNPYVDPSFLS